MADEIRTKRQTLYTLLENISGIERVLVTKNGITYNLPISLIATAEQLAGKLTLVGTPEEGDIPVYDGEKWVPGEVPPGNEEGPYGDFQIANGRSYTPELSEWIDITDFFVVNLAKNIENTDGIELTDTDYWRLSVDFKINIRVNRDSRLEFRLAYEGYGVPDAICRLRCEAGKDVSGCFRKMIEVTPSSDMRIVMHVAPDDPEVSDLSVLFNSGSVNMDSKLMEQPEPELYPSFCDETGVIFIDEEGYDLIDAEI